MSERYDAVIIGSGPNGLAAGIRLAQLGLSVKIFEAHPEAGGGTRTAELTLSGFKHDVCSAIHPMAVGSPYLSSLPLEDHGLEWIYPEIPLAHPLDDGAVALHTNLETTTRQFPEDDRRYRKLMHPLVDRWEDIAPDFLGPLRMPRHPLLLAQFGISAIQSADSITSTMKSRKLKALIAGLAGHSMLPFNAPASAAIALVLGAIGQTIGWPFPQGGAASLSNALVSYFRSLDGELQTNHLVNSLQDLPDARAYLFDTTPRQLVEIAGDQLPDSYVRRLENFEYGCGVFKLDLALEEPIPWKDPLCRRAGTVHVGGTYEEIARAELEVSKGKHPDKPYVLVAQHTLFDNSRAPEGKHTAWAYCHVPSGSTKDMTDAIERQIERFAPGFRDLILKRHIMHTEDFQAYNPNYIGGDINGGKQNWKQIFSRPVARINPYTTPANNIFICSSSTPPGGGVHGMCGYHAAETVRKKLSG